MSELVLHGRKLYIVLFLHQTTTAYNGSEFVDGCISYYSYIKPQHNLFYVARWVVVYRTIPTSNHNPRSLDRNKAVVVYRTIPTSNHNTPVLRWSYSTLYIVLFLHQTTTRAGGASSYQGCISYYSYIKPQLRDPMDVDRISCISYYSYIKPQPILLWRPTERSCISYYSYIKPQPFYALLIFNGRCISYYSYIKPQLATFTLCACNVVYRTIPTSNHNLVWSLLITMNVVYRTIPTSNHN